MLIVGRATIAQLAKASKVELTLLTHSTVVGSSLVRTTDPSSISSTKRPKGCRLVISGSVSHSLMD